MAAAPAAAPASLWWTAHSTIHKNLEACASSRTLSEAAQKSADAYLPWLQHNLSSFARPNADSARLITEAKPVTFKGRKYVLEPRLKSETLKLSKLLDLDELQTHILLKRWLRESGSEQTILEGVSVDSEALLPLHALHELVAYYHVERLLLLKCLQLIILEAAANEFFSVYATRLMEGGVLENKLLSSLRTNLDALAPAPPSASAPAGMAPRMCSTTCQGGTAPSIASRMVTVIKEFSSGVTPAFLVSTQTLLRNQVLQERCEMLSILILVYRLNLAELDPSRTLEIVTLVGGATWPASAAGAGGRVIDSAEGDGPSLLQLQQQRQQQERLGEAGVAAEHLAALLITTTLSPAAYINLARGGDGTPGSAWGRSSAPAGGALGGKVHEIHAQVRGWTPSPTSVGVLLAWSAIVRLLEPHLELGGVEDLHAAAFRSGGLDALSNMLQTPQLAVAGACAQVYREVVAESLSLITTAFDLSTAQLSVALFDSLLRLFRLLVAGNAALCSTIWDPDNEVYAPLRAILADTASLFPAVLGPYLGLLSALAEGMVSAARAYLHLQAACPKLPCLHPVDDPLLCWRPDGTVQPAHKGICWNRSPSVATMVLPVETVGYSAPLPAVLSHLEGQQRLILWDVCPSSDMGASFGQLLLLGRASQCLITLQQRGIIAVSGGEAGEELQDLRDILQLLAPLVQQYPALVVDLLTLKVTVGTEVDRTFLDVAAAATTVLSELQIVTSTGAGMPCSADAVAHALQLLAAFAQFHPMRVLAAVQALPLLAAQPAEQMLPAYPLSRLPDVPINSHVPLAGLLTPLQSFQAAVEAPTGRFPVTLAFLHLLHNLLQQGFSGGPLPAYVMYCLHELLPAHRQWQYNDAADRSGPTARYTLTAAVLRVVRMAIEAGMHVKQVDSQGVGEATIDETGSAEVHASALGGHVLQQLLLHGDALLNSALPPHAEALEALRFGGVAAQSQTDAAEGAAAEFLRLIPLLAAAASHYPQALPWEEYQLQPVWGPGRGAVAATSSVTPAAVVSSYIAYSPGEVDVEGNAATSSAAGSLPCHALRALHSLATCMARPAHEVSGGTAVVGAVLLPRGSAAEQALRACFTTETVVQRPALLAPAADVFEAAVQSHSELLDALLFPSALDSAVPVPAEPVVATEPVPHGGGSAQALLPAAARRNEAVAAAPPVRSALDGLWGLLQQSQQLREQQPEALAHALRCVVALWQGQAVAHRPVHLLRTQPGFWDALRGALPPSDSPHDDASAVHEDGAAQPEDDVAAWRTYCEACVWQLLTIEAFNVARQEGAASGTTAWTVIDQLAGLPTTSTQPNTGAAAPAHLLQALRRYSRPALSRTTVAKLSAHLQAAYLELGMDALGGVLLPANERKDKEEIVAVAGQMIQELSGLSSLLESGVAGQRDLLDAHVALMQYDGDGTAATGGGTAGSPTHGSGHHARVDGGGGYGTGRVDVAAMLLQRPLGQTLLAHSLPADAMIQGSRAPSYGPRFALASDRLVQLLGPTARDIPMGAEVVTSMDELSLQASLADARLAALEAAGALLAVVQSDHKLRPALLLGAASGPSAAGPSPVPLALSAAVECASSCVTGLLGWGGNAPAAALLEGRQYGLVQVLHAMSNGADSAPPRRGGVAVATSLAALPAHPAVGVPSSACTAVVGLMGSWLRAATREGAVHCSPSALQQLTDSLCGAALLALQLSQPLVKALGSCVAVVHVPSEQQLVQVALLDALPRLCSAAAAAGRGNAPPTAMQLVMEIVARHLPPRDWLPVLQSQLDLLPMLHQAAQRVQAYVCKGAPSKAQDIAAVGDLGLLQLALAVAQVPKGARMLHEQGALETLAGLARHLLSPGGGKLAAFLDDGPHPDAAPPLPFAPIAAPVHGRPAPPSRRQLALGGSGRDMAGPAAGHGPGVDLSGCYYGMTGAPSPVHQQWCVLLAFGAALIRTLAPHVDVEGPAMELLAAAEPRLLLSCQPPAADAQQPLTAAGVYELQRALFLLSQLSRFAGTWHMLLPGSMPTFRVAASSFLSFVAQPTMRKGYAPCCPPQSAVEKALLLVASGLPKTAGWFLACSQGSREGVLPCTPSAAPIVQPPTPLVPGAPGLLRLVAAGGTPGDVGGSHTNWGCSEYSARLAEGLYNCAHHALMFLVATSPQVDEGEGTSLGPMWPKPRELLALQEQCVLTAHSMVADLGGAKEVDARRRHICHLLLQVAQLAGEFLDAMGTRRRDDRLRERIALMEHHLAGGGGERYLAPLASVLSWSPSLSPAASDAL